TAAWRDARRGIPGGRRGSAGAPTLAGALPVRAVGRRAVLRRRARHMARARRRGAGATAARRRPLEAARAFGRASGGVRRRVGRRGAASAGRRRGRRIPPIDGGGVMDPIVTTALVGTGQRPAGDTPTTPELDALLAGEPAGSDERALLLRAGAWAVYKLA